MADQPITIDSGSHQRVAYDLMQKVIAAEHPMAPRPKERSYYFQLYRECLACTYGTDPKHVS